MRLLRVVDILQGSGTGIIVAGCYELPLELNSEGYSIFLIDTIDVLLKAAIEYCLGVRV